MLYSDSRTLLACLVAANLGVTTIAFAQPTASRAAVPSATAPGAVGVESYAHYTPFACATIPHRLAHVAVGKQRVIWRDQWPDTAVAKHVADSLASLTLRRSAGNEIRRCLEAQAPASVPARERLGVGLAQLAAEDDELARATFQQLVHANASASIAERAWLLSLIVEAYVGAGPEKIPTALQYMAQLDALGPAAAGRRLATRIGLYALAQGMDSLPFMEAMASAALKTSQELQGDGRIEWAGPRAAAVGNWADVEARRGHHAPALALLLEASKDFPNGELNNDILKFSFYGTTVSPLQAKFLYVPSETKPVTRPPFPVKGKTSLLVSVSSMDLERAMPMYAMLQRIHAKYANDVDIVLVTETMGWDYDGLVPDAETEASRIRAFFHDYLAMPAPIVIWARRSNGARDDGRLTFEPNPNTIPNGFARIVLVDKNGVVRMITEGGQEIRLSHMIDELAR